MGDHRTFKEEIKDLVDLWDDPDWESYSIRRKVQTAALEIIEAACVLLTGLDPDAADEDLNDIIQSAEELFDEYIEPIDLPVGNFLEGFIDASIRKSIKPSILAYVNWMR